MDCKTEYLVYFRKICIITLANITVRNLLGVQLDRMRPSPHYQFHEKYESGRTHLCYMSRVMTELHCKNRSVKMYTIDPFHLTSSSENLECANLVGNFTVRFHIIITLCRALCSEVCILGDAALIHVNLTAHQHGERGISRRV